MLYFELRDVEEVKTIKGYGINKNKILCLLFILWLITCFCCPRFRQFVLIANDKKVLDVHTPEGGLVAEFGHMV